jgi:hypothetical protein
MAAPIRGGDMSRAPAVLSGRGEHGMTGPVIHVQLLHVPSCPLAELVRATLSSSLSKTTAQVTIEDIEGPYPSPTLLVDGIDVTGRTPPPGPSCRLDLPTEDDVLAAFAVCLEERAS